MKVTGLIPMLYVPDVKAAVDFYTQMLGFKCNDLDKNAGWAMLSLDDAEIMLSLPNAHIPFEKSHFTGSLYFTVDHADEMWNRLKDRCEVCYPIENFPYGMREFAVYDNNHYLLQFGQELIL